MNDSKEQNRQSPATAQSLQDFERRTQHACDLINVGQCDRAINTLRSKGAKLLSDGDYLPPLWHWLYFLPTNHLTELGRDGHPQDGTFLPRIGNRRRMWAGSRCHFLAPIIIGRKCDRHSTISKITSKRGRSGDLLFVTISHKLTQNEEIKLVEDQDLVFLADQPRPRSEGKRLEVEFDWELSLSASECMLFRFSALTFNTHRIHYDAPYARRVEGYEDLVVHGPLQAILLLEAALANTQDRSLSKFSFKAAQPLYQNNPFTLAGHIPTAAKSELFTLNSEREICMSATIEWSE